MKILKKIGDVACNVPVKLNGEDGFVVAHLEQGTVWFNDAISQPWLVSNDTPVISVLTFDDLPVGEFFIIDSDNCLAVDRGNLYQKTGENGYRGILSQPYYSVNISIRQTGIYQEVTLAQMSWTIPSEGKDAD